MKNPSVNSRIVKLEVLNDTAKRTSVNAVESRTTSLEGDVATAQSDIATLQTDVSSAEGNISTLQGNVTTLTQWITTALDGKQPTLTISDVGTALLNLSTPTAVKIPRINADASVTLIDVPSNVEEVDADFVSISYNPSGASGGGTDFSPDALSGLKAWFKADSGVLKTDGSTAGDGDSVAIWQDQSGGGFHLAQVDGAKQPVLTPSAIGAHAALRFDAGSRYMLTTTGPSMDMSELTIAVVFRSLSPEPYQRLVVLGPTGPTGEDWNTPTRCMVSLADGGNCADFFANSKGVTIAGSRPPPPGVLIARLSRGRMVLIADDVVRSSVASVSSLSTSVGLLLGAHYASGSVSPSYGLDGYIAEVALFSRALSDFECGQLSNYLARWLR